ncbi:AfsR/SARP family transcriptional regulator [Pueribacillus theae]
METRTSERQSFQMDDTPTSIQCMGGFYLHILDGKKRTLAWKTNKEKEVCAFLIYHRDKPVDTDVIIEEIWPEYDLKKAKSYLYTCLSYLRKSLLENGFPAKINKFGKGFTFFANGLKSDEEMFTEILQEIISKDNLNGKIYRQMNALYKGEYMEGCGYQWAVSKQIDLKKLYIRALRKFYEYFKNRNVAMAEESLQRVLTITPDSEKDGRELIQLYMESGKRNEALNVYKQLEQVVHNHLGIELENETLQLYKQMNLHSYQ